jgi:ABC-type multidrug transport system fused ATPase/permease subunit
MAKTPAQRIKKHGSKAAVPQHHLPPVINPTTDRSPQKARSNSNLIVIAGVVASLFLFWYVHLLTLDQLRQLSGGLAMPDSLVGGFDADYVGELRAAMNDDARGQLNYVHKTAGTLFPLIFGFTWLLLIGTNVARKVLRWALWAVPLLFVVVRLWGNVAVDAALAAGTPDAGQVALASGLTVAGWVLFVLSLLAGAAAVFLSKTRAAGRTD